MNAPASPERFEELFQLACQRKLTTAERLELSGDQQSEIGKRKLQLAESEQRARMMADPVFKHSRPTAEEQARIAAAYALVEPFHRAVHEALVAVHAAGEHNERVIAQTSGYNHDSLSPEVTRPRSAARQLVARAERDLAAASYDRERAMEQARDVEREILAGVQARLRAASLRRNAEAAAEAAKQAAAQQAKPDPKPALYAAALEKLRVATGQRKAGKAA